MDHVWTHSIGASEYRRLRMVLNGGHRLALVATGAVMQGPAAKPHRAPFDSNDLEPGGDVGCLRVVGGQFHRSRMARVSDHSADVFRLRSFGAVLDILDDVLSAES